MSSEWTGGLEAGDSETQRCNGGNLLLQQRWKVSIHSPYTLLALLFSSLISLELKTPLNHICFITDVKWGHAVIGISSPAQYELHAHIINQRIWQMQSFYLTLALWPCAHSQFKQISIQAQTVNPVAVLLLKTEENWMVSTVQHTVCVQCSVVEIHLTAEPNLDHSGALRLQQHYYVLMRGLHLVCTLLWSDWNIFTTMKAARKSYPEIFRKIFQCFCHPGSSHSSSSAYDWETEHLPHLPSPLHITPAEATLSQPTTFTLHLHVIDSQ